MKGKIRVYCRVRPLSKSELDRVRTNVTSVLSRQTSQQVRARPRTYKCHVSTVASDRSASPSSTAYVQMSRQYCRVRPLSKSELDRVRTNVTSVLSRQTSQQVRARPRTYKCHVSTVASDLSASPSSTAYVQMSRQYCRVRPLSKSELDRVRTNVTSVLSRQTSQQVRARPRTYKCHVSTVASDRSASPSSTAYVQMSRWWHTMLFGDTFMDTLLVTCIICHNIITALFKLQDVCDRWLPPSGFLWSLRESPNIILL